MRLTRKTVDALLISFALLSISTAAPPYPVIQPAGSLILDTTDLAQCVEDFNEEDRWFFGVASDLEVSAINNGVYGGQFVLNGDAYDYLKEQIPLFDCPDPDFVKTYYYRWWTYRKHIKNLGSPSNPDLIVTEFIDPVGWADSTNAINAPLGHQLYEGRWLHDARVMRDYQRYWLNNPAARPRNYSAWLADGVFANQRVNPDTALMLELLTGSMGIKNLTENYDDWVNGVGTGGGASRRSDGLFWQNDDRDAMEVSFGGSGRRPSINSYMYADARAIASMYRILASQDPGQAASFNASAAFFEREAGQLRREVQDHLWDPGDEFFKTGYNDFDSAGSLHGRREQIGFTPWAFGLPEDGGAVDYDRAWTHLESFSTAVGLTSGALDESGYNVGAVGSCCRWDGPVWPFATTITLRGLGNLLQDYQQGHVDRADYFQQLETYTASHRQEFTQGGQTRTISWIDESMVSGGGNVGNWTQIGISRDGVTGNDNPRGLAYNHSGYVDLIVTGLVGLRPESGELVRVSPLVPDDGWDWFLLDHVLYHGRYLTILWDRDGTKYNRGAGLKVYADGDLIASAPDLQEVVGTLAVTNDTLLTATNPPDDAIDMLADEITLQATFNRVVQPGTGFIRLMRDTGSGVVIVESFDVASSSQTSFEGDTVSIMPTSPLLPSSDYHVLVDETAIQGDSGTSFAGFSEASSWNFSTDSMAPSIAARTPAAGAPAVSVRSDLNLTFDELVAKGSGSIEIKRVSNGEVLQVIDVSSPAVVINGMDVSMVLADLPVDILFVEIDAGAFTDASGNPFAGINGAAEWSFTTSATAGLILIDLLDEPSDIVNTGGVVHSACHFQDPTAGDPSPLVVNGIAHDVGRRTPTNLTENIAFEGDFRNGSSGLPADGSNVVQTLLSGIGGANGITMSIAGLTVGQEYLFQAYWEANGTSPQQTLTMTLENDTLTGIGPQGVPGGVLISYSFTASDTTLNAFFDRDDGATTGDQNNWLSGYSLQEVPSASSLELEQLEPENGATGLPVTVDLRLTFNQAVSEGSGSVVVRRISDDGVEQSIDVSSESVTVAGLVVDVALASLPPAVYYVEVDDGAFVDSSGSAFEGISGSAEWSFTTVGSTAAITASLLDEPGDIVNTGGALVSAVHFQNPAAGDPSPLLLNGIPHIVGQANEPLLTDNIGFEGDFRNGASGLPADGSDLVQVLLSGIGGANGLNLEVDGLTIGRAYLFQAYWEDDRGTSLTTTMEGVTQNGIAAQQSRPSVPGGTLVSFSFVAGDGSLNAFFDRDDGLGGDPNNWLSGYSLQEIPGVDATYADWIADFPGVGSENEFQDDPDGDSLVNGVEAWLGSDPTAFSAGIENLSTDGTTSVFSHSRNPSPPTDLIGRYEWSPNLQDWYLGDGIDGPTGGPTILMVPLDSGGNVTVSATASAAQERVFLRIAVDQN